MGKRLLWTVIWASATVLGACSPAPPKAPPAERQSAILNLLGDDCGACHGSTLAGGLGPSLRPADLKNVDNDALVDIIRNGVPGTAMPAWGEELSEKETRWLVAQLKKGLPQSSR